MNGANLNGVNFVFDGNYLVAEIANSDSIINYQMQMLVHTEVNHLLPVKRQMKNNMTYLYYDLSGKTALNRLVTHKKMPDSAYVAFVKSTLKAVNELEEYQLSADGIVLDDNYVFVHPGDYAPSFVYLPLQGGVGGVNGVISYLKNMLVSDIVDIRNSNFMQQTISVLNSGNSLHDMLIQLEGVSTGSGVGAVNQIPQASPSPAPRQTYEAAPQPQVQNIAPQAQKPVQPQPVPQPQQVSPVQKPVQPQQASQFQKPNVGRNAAVPGGVAAPTAKPKVEKMAKAKAPVEAGQPDMNKIRPILMAISVVIVIAFAALFASGTFTDEAGNTDYTALIGIPIFLAAANYFAYTKLKVKYVISESDAAAANAAPKAAPKPAPKVAQREVVVPAQPVKPNVQPTAPQPQSYAQPINVEPAVNSVQNRVNQQTSQPMNTASMWSFDDGGKTEVLTDTGMGASPYLQSASGEMIYINGQITRIGKLKGQVDAVVSNPKVSRVHADIIMHDGKMYVMDLGSANGTYINGSNERLNVNMEYELHNNDKVVFANEEYTVHC